VYVCVCGLGVVGESMCEGARPGVHCALPPSSNQKDGGKSKRRGHTRARRTFPCLASCAAPLVWGCGGVGVRVGVGGGQGGRMPQEKKKQFTRKSKQNKNSQRKQESHASRPFCPPPRTLLPFPSLLSPNGGNCNPAPVPKLSLVLFKTLSACVHSHHTTI